MKVTIAEELYSKEYQAGDILQLKNGEFVQIHSHSIDNSLRYYLSFLDGYGKIGRDDFKHRQSFASIEELVNDMRQITPIIKHYSKDDYEIKIVPKKILRKGEII